LEGNAIEYTDNGANLYVEIIADQISLDEINEIINRKKIFYITANSDHMGTITKIEDYTD